MLACRPVASLTFALLALVLGPAAVPAADRLVPDTYSTIQSAISAASPGDEVKVSSTGSPYVETVVLLDGISVRGGFSSDFLVQDPLSYETVIQRPPGGGSTVGADNVGPSVVFEGFTVTGGDSTFAGGGMFCGSSTFFTIRDCIFRGNRANITGGGMQIGGGSQVRVVDCLFENNFAGQRGGAITIAPSANGAIIERCIIRACSTGTGGVQGGGGIFCASSIVIQQCRFENNYTPRDGGGLYVAVNATEEIRLQAWGNLFIGNGAAGNGGGIYHDRGSSEHNGTLLEENVAGTDGAGNGGGVYFNGGTNRFNKGFIRGNSAGSNGAGFGGGIYCDNSENTTITLTEIVSNTARFGGGAYLEGPAQGWSFSNFDHCSITRNISDGVDAGGGIHALGQEIGAITNCIIADQLDGSGISTAFPASLNIRFNDVFNLDILNLDPEYGLNCTDRTGINGNIKADPRFCDPLATPPDLALQVSSPCRGAGEGATDIGAHDADKIACGTISLEPSSWGKIKALYR